MDLLKEGKIIPLSDSFFAQGVAIVDSDGLQIESFSGGVISGTASTITSIPYSDTAVTGLADNPDRQSFTIWNNADKDLYYAFGTTASLALFTAILVPGQGRCHTETVENISFIWVAAGTGTALVTEVV